MTEEEIKAENHLNKCLADFERATLKFMRYRCYAYHQFVVITAKKLLEASDARAAAGKLISPQDL